MSFYGKVVGWLSGQCRLRVELNCEGGKGLQKCSQSRVGVLAGSRRWHPLLRGNVARGGLRYRTTSRDVLNMHQWAHICVDRGRIKLEQSHLGILPGLWSKTKGARIVYGTANRRYGGQCAFCFDRDVMRVRYVHMAVE